MSNRCTHDIVVVLVVVILVVVLVNSDFSSKPTIYLTYNKRKYYSFLSLSPSLPYATLSILTDID